MAAVGNTGHYKAELGRMTRLYSTLAEIHHAIVRLSNRQELFQQICKVVVEQGGFRLASIGWIDPRSLQVVPVAQYGNHTAYLERVPMYADERPTGMGPIGRAIRSGKPYICNDYFNDPATELWREAAAEQGFRAAAYFPIYQKGMVSGLLNLFAGAPGHFRDLDVQLFEQTASDISFALDRYAQDESRHQAEDAARLLASIAESISDAIISESVDGIIQVWNEAAERMYGYTAEEAIGKSIFMLVPAGRIAETKKLLADVCAGRSFVGIETERIHKSGFRLQVAITLSPVRDGAGRVVGVSKISRDISEQNTSLAALEESSGLLKIMINEAPTGLAMLDLERRVLACSERWKEDRGLSGIDAVGRMHDELFPNAPELWRQQHLRALAGETIVTEADSYVRSDGQVRWLSRTLRPWMTGTGEIGGIVVLSEDITERKLADDARRRSEEFLKIFIEDTPVALAMFDRDLRYLGANQCWRRDTGAPNEQLIGRYRYEVNPSVLERWKDADRRALQGETVRSEEDLFERPGKAPMWLRWEVRPWKEADGSVGGIIILVEDVTERKLALKAREEAEAYLRTVVDNLDAGLFLASLEGRLLAWNPAARRIYGIPEQGYDTLPLNRYPEFVTLFNDAGAELTLEEWPLSRVLRGEQLHDVEYRSRSKFVDHDMMLSYSGMLVEMSNGGKLGFLRCEDVTVQRATEQALRMSQARLEAVIDSLDEGLMIVTPDGAVLRWNPIVTRVVGFTLEEKPGFRAQDFLGYVEVLDAQGRPVAAENTPMRRILAGEELHGAVYKVRRKDTGHVYTFNYFGALLDLENGSRLAFIKFREIMGPESSADSSAAP